MKGSTEEGNPAAGWTVLYRAPDQWRAEILRGLLVDDGIPALVQSHMVPGYANVLLSGSSHWGDVLVPRKCEREALEVLRSAFGE